AVSLRPFVEKALLRQYPFESRLEGRERRPGRRRGAGAGTAQGRMRSSAPANDEALDELLSRPRTATVDALRKCPGDVVVLGAGGKMGPTLARMVARAAIEADTPRR